MCRDHRARSRASMQHSQLAELYKGETDDTASIGIPYIAMLFQLQIQFMSQSHFISLLRCYITIFKGIIEFFDYFFIFRLYQFAQSFLILDNPTESGVFEQ